MYTFLFTINKYDIQNVSIKLSIQRVIKRTVFCFVVVESHKDSFVFKSELKANRLCAFLSYLYCQFECLIDIVNITVSQEPQCAKFRRIFTCSAIDLNILSCITMYFTRFCPCCNVAYILITKLTKLGKMHCVICIKTNRRACKDLHTGARGVHWTYCTRKSTNPNVDHCDEYTSSRSLDQLNVQH